MGVSIVPGAKEFTQANGLRRARLFDILPNLAAPLYLTTHANQLRFGNKTYSPAGVISASAQSEATGGEDYDVSFQGALTSDRIRAIDLNSGVYDKCVIIERVVDWMYPMAGAIRTYRYYIEDVRYNGETFEARLAGIQGLLRKQRGGTYTRLCPADLGAFYCGKDLTTVADGVFPLIGITEVLSTRRYRLDQALVPQGLGDDWFLWGKIEWKVGPNRFRLGMIVDYDDTERIITLLEPPVFAVTANQDLLDLYAGCDKTFASCAGKFNNHVAFQGMRFIRGADQYFKTPQT